MCKEGYQTLLELETTKLTLSFDTWGRLSLPDRTVPLIRYTREIWFIDSYLPTFRADLKYGT